jgi:class 3 adenylate cyclase
LRYSLNECIAKEAGMDLLGWLRSLGLQQYEGAFRENAIETDLLPKLTNEDLKELGVTLVGHRRKLLDAIATLRAENTRPSESTDIPSASPADVTGERRQVTVLFADLAGYTGWGQQLDAEEVHGLLEQYFDRADRAIHEHGGHIDKHIGDCVMGVFGAPISHGNDAERAARAALAIQAAVPEISASVGRNIGVHIGLAGGQVVASRTGSTSHSEYTVTGDTVNLASRLTSAAKPGEVLISDETRGALAERFDFDDAGALDIKGFADPVWAWRLRGVRPAAREQRPFVGRRGELRLIEAALATCREIRRGQVVYLRGEAGIGKTRLIEEVQRAAIELGFACHTVLVLDFGSVAGRDAIRALTGSLLGLELTSDGEATRAVAAAALSSDLVTSDDAVFLNVMLDLPQPPELRSTYEAMDSSTRSLGRQRVAARILEHTSLLRPRLLIVEDLHWADQPTLAHLAKLTTTVAEYPAVLIMTSRIEGDQLDEAWQAEAASAQLTTINLGPLPPGDARTLAEALLVANTAFAQRCVERAAGNPLFLDQLLRHADESQAIAVPGSVQSLVQARIDRLDPGDQAAIQAASVLGQRFTQAALAHLLDKADYVPERLVSRLLLRPQQTSGEVFLFTHVLIRDAIYDNLLRGRRRELHLRAADFYGDRDLLLRAEHLERAGDPRTAQAYLARISHTM